MLVLAIVLITGAFGLLLRRHTTQAGVTGLTVSQSFASRLPKQSPNIPKTYLASGLTPPTNKWFSAIAFANQPEPVFAYPLSYKLSSTGYGVGNPPVVSSPNAVFASHVDDVAVNLGASNHVVQSYDDLSVLVAQQDANQQTVATSRITHGSPFIFTTFVRSTMTTLTTTGSTISGSDGKYQLHVGDRQYGIYTTASTTSVGQTLLLNAKAGDLLTIFALPNGASSSQYFAAATRPITATSVTYTTSAHHVTTTYHLDTRNGNSLFAATPDMQLGTPASIGSFTTLLGTQSVYSGTAFTDTEPAPMLPSSELPLGKLTDGERADVIAKLGTDASSLDFTQIDSYFGGKELYRAANLLQIAESLHQSSLANDIKIKLAARLSQWFDPTGSTKRPNIYFYYDSAYHGIVGSLASYGSEGFNDHHFHYGYFIYAAAVLSKYDPDFYKTNAAMVNLLISDLASNASSTLFPKLRVFDSYAGHSWASGNGDFGDGNNQESSSEASNAWYGMYLWSQVAHNQPLASESTWLYAHETRTAQNIYLKAPTSVNDGPNYGHSTVGIIWGGKLDYSTFFSPRPQAVLGIQLIPMSPGQAYLRDTAINKNIAGVAATSAELAGQFNDYLVMYQALTDPQLALRQASQITSKDLDNGNSSSYMYAWLYSQNHR
jgi:endo-1,3(4)-beta-glucanase